MSKYARLPNGKKVLFKTDGTWEYVHSESSAFTNSTNFRNVKWGMSKDDIKGIENEKLLLEKENYLGYEGKALGENCWIFHFFAHDMLISAGYHFTHEHSNKTDYLTDYNKFKGILSEKYGQPLEDEMIWKDDLYRDDY